MGHAMLLHNQHKMSSSPYISGTFDAIEYTTALCWLYCCQAFFKNLQHLNMYVGGFLLVVFILSLLKLLMPVFTTLNKRILIYNPSLRYLTFIICKQKHITFLSMLGEYITLGFTSAYCNAFCAQTDTYMLIIAWNILIISTLAHTVTLMHHGD